MSKQNNIRWRESDLAELRRLTRNYNAKITRQRAKLIEADRRYEAAQLPQKKSVRELREAIGTRRDFNRELDLMQHFIDTGLKYKLGGNTKKSLHATVRDFNAKITRLSARAKTQGERAGLPEKIDPKWLQKNTSSEEELVKELANYKRFLRRGAEELVELPDTKHNIKITKWQKETMETYRDIINKARDREKAEWLETEVNYGGKRAGYTQGQARMDKNDFHGEFAHITTHSYSSTYSEIREKYRLMIRERQNGYWHARTQLARINYIEKMDSVIGDHPIGKLLMKQIKNMPLKDFKRELKADDDLFFLLYDLENQMDEQGFYNVLEQIWGTWNPDKEMYSTLDAYIEKEARKI